MTTETVDLTVEVTNVLEAIRPFQADDGHKGSFLVLRIAGLGQGTALRIINRKYRSWQNWRSTDDDFRRIDEALPGYHERFGGEARVLRTALLDISIIEAGIGVFKRILNKQPVSSDMWTYATRLAGLRVPMMIAADKSGSPWERLANAIKQTVSQRELVVKEEWDGTKSVTARETIIEPSTEQKQVANDIVENMIRQAAGAEN